MSDEGGPRLDGMPMLGLGTSQHDEPAAGVRRALELGYRHVDTATMYGNEAAVGEGLAAADVDESAVFVATKVWHDSLDYDGVVESAERSREALGVGSIDLLYVHWPGATYEPEETLSAFADLRDDGVIDRVGVANFDADLLAEAVRTSDAPIFANQVEYHPLLRQPSVRAACEEHGVHLVAYAPLAQGDALDDPTVAEVAATHDATPAQVALAWLRAKGLAAIPKATGDAHLRENLGSLDLELDDASVARIDGIDREVRKADPPFGPW